MAPATKPPRTPAPTAHPKQRASAGVGAAAIAVATVAAAAKAVSVFFISVSLSVGGCRALSVGGCRARFQCCDVRIAPTEPTPDSGNIIRLICRNLVSPGTAQEPLERKKGGARRASAAVSLSVQIGAATAQHTR